MFTHAIVRKPCRSMVHGLTESNMGPPDYKKALLQHAAYVGALKECGLAVTVMDADEKHPDSTFIEDTALLTRRCAIITRPGAASRRGETAEVEKVLSRFYSRIEAVKEPGTVDAGDIMMAGAHFYIGLSQRTNEAGAAQVIDILKRFGMSGTMMAFGGMLHLKTGAAYLENNNLVASGSMVTRPEFQAFNLLEVDRAESAAANCVWINGTVLLAGKCPKLKAEVEKRGYGVIGLDVSEFQKLDGGLSCLSLRF